MESISPYEEAINVLRIVADAYRIPIEIRIGARTMDGKFKAGGKSFWRIRVMDKLFIQPDFVECAREAVKFIYEAHGREIEK